MKQPYPPMTTPQMLGVFSECFLCFFTTCNDLNPRHLNDWVSTVHIFVPFDAYRLSWSTIDIHRPLAVGHWSNFTDFRFRFSRFSELSKCHNYSTPSNMSGRCFQHKQNQTTRVNCVHLEGEPLPDGSGVITPVNGLINGVTGVVTLLLPDTGPGAQLVWSWIARRHCWARHFQSLCVWPVRVLQRFFL